MRNGRGRWRSWPGQPYAVGDGMMLTFNLDKTQIATFKGKFVGKPAEKEQWYNSQFEDDNKHWSPDWG